MNILYIASANPHKIRELRQMLSDHGFAVKGLPDIPNYLPPQETGQNFLENAQIKAKMLTKYLRDKTNHQRPPPKADPPLAETTNDYYILADDSGLECYDLGMQPGLQSARFAGPNATDQENNTKLIQSLQAVPHLSRAARYVCALVLVLPDGTTKEIVETCEGNMVFEPKGENGFGYDPYFYLPELDKTMAELSPEQKNQISHRGKALRRLLKLLESRILVQETKGS